jgi:fructokinase
VTAGGEAAASVPPQPVDVLVIGEALIDIVHGDGRMLEHPGGSPANVALGLGRLGLGVDLLTDLGRDQRGDRIAAHLASSGVQVLPESFSNRRTSTAAAIIGPDGSASYVFDLRWDPHLEGLVTAPQIVHTGSIAAFLDPGADAVREVLVASAAGQALVSVDPNVRPALMPSAGWAAARFEEFARLADVVKLSDEDAAWLYPGQPDSIVLDGLLDLGVRLAVVTRGADGAVLATRDHRVAVPARPVDVRDTIGAGDSFTAALLAGLLHDGAIPADPEALRRLGTRAVQAAAITVGRPGADLPTAAELESALRAHVVDACTAACMGTVAY